MKLIIVYDFKNNINTTPDIENDEKSVISGSIDVDDTISESDDSIWQNLEQLYALRDIVLRDVAETSQVCICIIFETLY